jgi:formylglycine-generating enzyme required for sulfatase activity
MNECPLRVMSGNPQSEHSESAFPPKAEVKQTSLRVRFGPTDCEVRVMRGGSFAAGESRVRSAYRWPIRLNARYHNVGFRVVLDLETQ